MTPPVPAGGRRTASLLLTSPLAPVEGRRALQEALARRGPLAAPHWALDPAAPDLLGGPAAGVLAALAALPPPVVVCGVGAGAVLALRVAADGGDAVAGVVLATGRPRSGARLVRSVHRGVVDLLPLPVLRRLRAPERLLVQTLDLVRPQDVLPLARRVPQPARVAWGRRDPLDRLPAARLAAALPAGELAEVDDAGPGWPWSTPEHLVDLVVDLRPGP